MLNRDFPKNDFSKILKLAVFSGIFFSLPSFAVAPIANDDARSINVNFAATIDVLNNDSDPDGDDIVVVSVTQPQNGTVTLNEDGGVTYTPAVNFVGIDSFSYTIEDLVEVPEQATATVTVTVTSTEFTTPTDDINDRSVASALSAACDALSSLSDIELSNGQALLATRCDALRDLAVVSPESIAAIIEDIAPEETLALLQVASSASQLQSRAVRNRIHSMGQGIQEASENSVAWHYHSAYASAGDESIQSPLNLFLSIQAKDTERERTELENGFDLDTLGLTFGVDYAFTPDMFLGLALGSTANTLEYLDDQGEVDTDVLTLIAFYSINSGNFAFDFQLGFDESDFEVNRFIEYEEAGTTLDITSEGETSGSQVFVFSSAQYTFDWQAFNLSPFFQLEYRDGEVESYRETNIAGFDVELDAQSYDETNLNIGTRGQFILRQSWGVLIPNFNFEIINRINDTQSEVEGRFIFSPVEESSFVLNTDDPDSLFYRAGLGLTAVFPRGFSGFLSYEQIIDQDYFDTSKFNLGFRLEL